MTDFEEEALELGDRVARLTASLRQLAAIADIQRAMGHPSWERGTNARDVLDDALALLDELDPPAPRRAPDGDAVTARLAAAASIEERRLTPHRRAEEARYRSALAAALEVIPERPG